jgi:hypothetical protein
MRGRRWLALIAAALLLIVGCATAASPGSSPSKTISPSGLLSPSSGPVSPVVGTVASVAPPAPAASASPKATAKGSAKPTKSPSPAATASGPPVLGFTLVTTAGETLTFTIGELDNEDEFPASDLYGRITTEDPIRVFFTVDGDTLIVNHIEDAT